MRKNVIKSTDNSGHRSRVKEKILSSKSLSNLADYEILEALLFFCHPRSDVKPIAKSLVQKFPTFGELMSNEKSVVETPLVGKSLTIILKLLKEMYSRTHKEEMKKKIHFSDISTVVQFLSTEIGYSEIEKFYVILLDAGSRMIDGVLMNVGTVDQSAVYPREILKLAIQHNATSIIISHNHPSGKVIPSEHDILVTDKISQALSGVDIVLQDHIIVAKNKYLSFREKGVITV